MISRMSYDSALAFSINLVNVMVSPQCDTYQAFNPSFNASPPNRQTYQAFKSAANAGQPTKPKVVKQTAKRRAPPVALMQIQLGPAVYFNLLETMFQAPIKFDKKGFALYTIGVNNTSKGAANMKKKDMTCHRFTGQVIFWWRVGKM
jgi:hypothetical protein